VGPPPDGAALGEATRALLFLPDGKRRRYPKIQLVLVHRLFSIPPLDTPLPIFIFAFYIFAMKYNKNGIDPGGGPISLRRRRPHRGQQDSGPSADITASPFWGAVDIDPRAKNSLIPIGPNLIRSLDYTICCGTQHISSVLVCTYAHMSSSGCPAGTHWLMGCWIALVRTRQ